MPKQTILSKSLVSTLLKEQGNRCLPSLERGEFKCIKAEPLCYLYKYNKVFGCRTISKYHGKLPPSSVSLLQQLPMPMEKGIGTHFLYGSEYAVYKLKKNGEDVRTFEFETDYEYRRLPSNRPYQITAHPLFWPKRLAEGSL